MPGSHHNRRIIVVIIVMLAELTEVDGVAMTHVSQNVICDPTFAVSTVHHSIHHVFECLIIPIVHPFWALLIFGESYHEK